MSRQAPAWSLPCLLLASLPLQAAESSRDVETLAGWWPGIYDTSEQLVYSQFSEPGDPASGSEVRIRTIVAPLALPWLGEHVLYVEEFPHDDPEDLRRQTLMKLVPNRGGGVRVRLYTLREPGRFRHLHRSPALIPALTMDDLEADPGCDLVMRREVQQFSGGTEGNACRDDSASEARYVDYRLLVGEDLYWYRLRRYAIRGNELLEEVAGYTWFQMFEARLFSCSVRWKAPGQPGEWRSLASFDVHDQGGKGRFETPDGRRIELELHGRDWPFTAGRASLILVLAEKGRSEPLITSWTQIEDDTIGARLDWLDVRCAAVVPDRPEVGS